MIGLFANQDKEITKAIVEGLRLLGKPFLFRDTHGFDNDSHYEDKFTSIIVHGDNKKGKALGSCWNKRNRPALYVSGSYTRHKDYYRFGLNDLNWVPPNECPSDRFEALNIHLNHKHKNGWKVLIAAHVPGNYWTTLITPLDINKWVKHICDLIAVNYPIENVYFRKHPKDHNKYFPPCRTDDNTKPINWQEYVTLITFNSTIGVEAIINGVPVVCDPSAAYSNIANSFETLYKPQITKSPQPPIMFPKNLYFPSNNTKFFNRLAYAQWSIEEIASGKPFEWLRENYIPTF